MKTKVKDLSVEEFQSLISSTVKETMEDLIEDTVALSSEEYLRSVEEASEKKEEGVKSLLDSWYKIE